MTGKKNLRHIERTFAFKVLYGFCFSPPTSEREMMAAFVRSPDKPGHVPDIVNEHDNYAWFLCKNIWEQRQELDNVIASFSKNWRMERLGRVEITVLRIAIFELMRQHLEVPPKVAINEAVELSKQFSDNKARVFINGILDAATKALDSGKLPPLPHS